MKMVKLLVAAMVLATGRLWADTETVNGVAWEYEVSDGEATVTGIPKGTAGALTVPATLGGYPVTTVGDYAFKSCEGLVSVSFASSSIKLGTGAFEECTALERVALPSEVWCFVSVGGKGGYPWVRGIPGGAFMGCHALKSIALPDGILRIGMSAFRNCWALEEIVIPASVEYIDYLAFVNCETLARVETTGRAEGQTTADYLRDLLGRWEDEDGTISLCEELEDGSAVCYAFKNALDAVFNRTLWYESLEPFALIVEDGVVTDFTGACPAHLVIPEGVTEIVESAFDADYSASPMRIKTVSLPSTLRKVGKWAFYYCTSLESVMLPAGVTTMDEGAFLSCTGLVSVALSPRLETLPPSAFRYCLSLRELTIPASVSFIGERALKDCQSLTRLTFEGDAPEIEDDSAFENIPDACTVYVSPSSTGWGVEIPGTWRGLQIAYSTNPQWKYELEEDGGVVITGVEGSSSDVVVPSMLNGRPVVGIGQDAFRYCTGLSSITIPDSVRDIGRGAFEGCSGLTSVAIPDAVTNIGFAAFCDCENLTSVTIGKSVERIGAESFWGCGGLTSVTIPASLTNIDGSAFGECGASEGFSVETGNAAYSVANGLLLSKNGTRLEQGVNGDVTIPSSVTVIGEFSFCGRHALTSVSIPNTVTSIEEDAFYLCDALKVMTLPPSLKELGESAFENCEALAKIVVPEGVTDIPNLAFEDCIGLKQIVFPASLSTIASSALVNDRSLESVIFKGNAPSVYATWSGPELFNVVEDRAAYYYINPECTVYVKRDSTGWGGSIPGTWQGRRIEYISGGNAAGGDGSGTVDAAFGKVQTVQGALYDADGKLAGAVTLKVGKKSKKGIMKISGSVLLLNGKKAAAKVAQLVPGADGSGEVALVFKAPVGAMTLRLSADGTFTCDGSGYTMVRVEVGGAWTASGAKVCVALADGALPGGTRDELLPTEENGGEPITPKGGKWGFAKAAQVKWAKDRATGAFGLTVNTAGGKTNKSGLKLTYAPKTGLFKGSFKVYAVVDNRLKKYTAKVTGLVVDGKGQGTATMTKPSAATWAVTVEYAEE